MVRGEEDPQNQVVGLPTASASRARWLAWTGVIAYPVEGSNAGQAFVVARLNLGRRMHPRGDAARSVHGQGLTSTPILEIGK